MNTNFALKFPYINPEGKHEIICLNCNNKYWAIKVLGLDNTMRELPHMCPYCNGLCKIDREMK